MKNILFINYGVGGSEALNPLYLKFKQEGFNVENISIAEFNLSKLDDAQFVEESDIYDYIKDKNPVLVINERSNGLDVQNKITKFCKEKNIFNICVLDMYGNYQSRLLEKPDYLIVPEKDIYEDLIISGYPEDKMAIGGNPAFDVLDKYTYYKNNNPERYKILYTSQPLKERTNKDQFLILKNFLNVFDLSGMKYDLYIKLHPNEIIENWKDYESNLVENCCQEEMVFYMGYDLIFGYRSTPMMKTRMIGIPTVFYDVIKSQEELSLIVENYLQQGMIQQYHRYMDFEKNATNKCCKIIVDILKDKRLL